ncbi:MAG: DUF1266 domain-containing protein [Actinoallomurus sp.]
MGGTGSGRLTLVQQWILGPSAVFADVNGFAVDRLGVKHNGQHEEALEFLTGASWGFQTPQDLLDQADLLIQHGHRADFAQTARMTALPPPAREEFGDLLRQMDALVKRKAAGPGTPGPGILRRLVILRFGPAYAPLFDRLYSGDAPPHTTHPNAGPPHPDHPNAGYPNTGHPSAGYPDVGQSGAGHPPSGYPDFGQRPVAGTDGDISTTEMLEMRSFLNSVFTDPDYADEEPRRLEMWLDPTFPREPSRYMIWDYARVMLLLRCGQMADWLPEEFCWDRLFELAMDVQRHYTSWHDMATCYLQGRLMWSGGTAGHQDRFEQAAKALAADPGSPWNRVPWHLPLRRDWP